MPLFAASAEINGLAALRSVVVIEIGHATLLWSDPSHVRLGGVDFGAVRLGACNSQMDMYRCGPSRQHQMTDVAP